jgi:hypothetical protein
MQVSRLVLKLEVLDMVARMVWTLSAGAFYWAGWYIGVDELHEVATLIIGAVWIRRPGDSKGAR